MNLNLVNSLTNPINDLFFDLEFNVKLSFIVDLVKCQIFDI